MAPARADAAATASSATVTYEAVKQALRELDARAMEHFAVLQQQNPGMQREKTTNDELVDSEEVEDESDNDAADSVPLETRQAKTHRGEGWDTDEAQ